MKRIYLFLIGIVIIYSCSKKSSSPDPNPNPTPGVTRLLSSGYNSGNDSVRYYFYYDASGRINKIDWKNLNSTVQKLFDVSYSGSEIRLTNGDNTMMILTVNANNQLVKRTDYRYNHQMAPAPESWALRVDTFTYQYSADGFRIGGTRVERDSSWTDPSTSHVTKQNVTMTYTITNGNITESKEVTTQTDITHSPTQTLQVNSGTEFTKDFDFTSGYLNKTDFSNGIVLTELSPVPVTEIPVDEHYKNLPNKLAEVYIMKDQFGNIIDSYPLQWTYQYTYNSDGWVTTMSPSPGDVTKFVYGPSH